MSELEQIKAIVRELLDDYDMDERFYDARDLLDGGLLEDGWDESLDKWNQPKFLRYTELMKQLKDMCSSAAHEEQPPDD